MIQYIIGASTYMVVLYIFYLLLLSNDTHYRRNRAYLIISLLLSLSLPLIKLDIASAGGLSSIQDNLTRLIALDEVIVLPEGGSSSVWLGPNFLWILYFCGVFTGILFTASHAIRIYRIIHKGRIAGTNKVYTNFNNISGFSAFGYIFLSTNLDHEEELKIEEHEQKHIDHNHFSDLIFLKTISIVFWFNPFIYLYNRSLKAIHEYQADARMIDEGANPVSYTSLLLNQVFRTKLFTIQNAFANKTLIKKRIIMMTKQKTRNIAGLKLLLTLPLTAILFFLFSCSQNETEQKVQKENLIETEEAAPVDNLKETEKPEKEVFSVVEEMPTFLGGDFNSFRDWVQKRVKYPQIAAENGIQGKVFVMFNVNEDGTVSHADVIKGVDPILDNEALRVVNESPLWVAGKQSGKEVAVKITVLVNFQLK